jgi:hypothetical protein
MLKTALSLPPQIRTRTLLCIDIPEPVLAAIQARGYTTEVGNLNPPLIPVSQLARCRADVVLLNVTNGGKQTIELTQRLWSALRNADNATRVLCFSTAQRDPRFALALEKCGARYVRISDTEMLIESVELLLAEMTDFECSDPCFQITHRFSQGTCAPGEEIGMIEWDYRGNLSQLRLALSGRFVFNCLAENQPHALDSFQIASLLCSGWFYRDHAKNSGTRQPAKVRVATIKVLMQRIRDAMTSAFARVGLARDPYEVLQSISTEGSRRALYRLNAKVNWKHTI